MRLEQYEAEVVALENGTFTPAPWAVNEYGSVGEATRAAARVLAAELRRALWQAWAKQEALDLADRAEKIAHAAH